MSNHSKNCRIDNSYHINDESGSELIAIVSVKDGWISNHTKIPLQLKGNKHWFLSRQRKEGSESSAVILDCHYPALKLPINIGTGHLPIVHKINLKAITPCIRENWLFCTFLTSNDGVGLNTNMTSLAVTSHHFLSNRVMLW